MKIKTRSLSLLALSIAMLLNSGTTSHAADPTPPTQDLNLNSPEAVEQLKQDVLAQASVKRLIDKASESTLNNFLGLFSDKFKVNTDTKKNLENSVIEIFFQTYV